MANDCENAVKRDLPQDLVAWPTPTDRHDGDSEHLGTVRLPMKQDDRDDKLTSQTATHA